MIHKNLTTFRRRLFNFVSAISFLLCLATIALWIRSYWRLDGLYRLSASPNPNYRRVLSTQSCWGVLATISARSAQTEYPKNEWLYATHSSPREAWGNGEHSWFLGFGYYSRKTPIEDRVLLIYVPHWFLSLVFATLPTVRLRLILRTRKRHRLGLCEHCGYDLRATLQGNRCPECGNASNPLDPSPRSGIGEGAHDFRVDGRRDS